MVEPNQVDGLAPSAASATTSMPSVPLSSLATDWRTSVWSSARTTRIVVRHGSRPPQGHVDLHAGPPVGPGPEVEGRTDQVGTFLHRRNPTPRSAGTAAGSIPTAVVEHLQVDVVRRPATGGRPRRRAAPCWMALLTASCAMRSSCRAASGARSSVGPASTTTRRSRALSRVPAQSGPYRDPQTAEPTAGRSRSPRTSSTAWPTTSRSRAMSLGVVVVEHPPDQVELETHVDQRLDHAVVQVAGDPAAFLVDGELADAGEEPRVVQGQRGLLGESHQRLLARSCDVAALGTTATSAPACTPSSSAAPRAPPGGSSVRRVRQGASGPPGGHDQHARGGSADEAEGRRRRRAPPRRPAARRRRWRRGPRAGCAIDLVEHAGRCPASRPRPGPASTAGRAWRAARAAARRCRPRAARWMRRASTPMTLDSGMSAPHADDGVGLGSRRARCRRRWGRDRRPVPRPTMAAPTRGGKRVADLGRDHGREQQERRPVGRPRGQGDRQRCQDDVDGDEADALLPYPHAQERPEDSSTTSTAVGRSPVGVGERPAPSCGHRGDAGDAEDPVDAGGRRPGARTPAPQPRRTARPAGRTRARRAGPPTSTGRRSTGPGMRRGDAATLPDHEDRPGCQPVVAEVLDRPASRRP